MTNDEYDQVIVNGVETMTITGNGTYRIQLFRNQEVIDERQITIMNIDMRSPTGQFTHYGDYYVL